MPIGTLIQKIQCQLSAWVMPPPISGPLATARPAMPPQIPTTAPRFSGGKADIRRMKLASGIADGGTDALDSTEHDEDVARFGADAQHGRGDGEERQADHVDPASSEPVSECGSGRDSGAEGDRVHADRPLEQRNVPAESSLDRRNAVTTATASSVTMK